MDAKIANELLADDNNARIKKCGHPYRYKCCCYGGENSDKVFDCVDEMMLRSKLNCRKKKNNKCLNYLD